MICTAEVSVWGDGQSHWLGDAGIPPGGKLGGPGGGASCSYTCDARRECSSGNVALRCAGGGGSNAAVSQERLGGLQGTASPEVLAFVVSMGSRDVAK